MERLLWILLGILGLTLVILIFAESSGRVLGMASEDFAQVIYLGTLVAALVAGGAIWRQSLSSALRNAAIWMALIFAVAALYTYSDTIQNLVAGRF